MNRAKVAAAIAEAERFLAAARTLLDTDVPTWNGGRWETAKWGDGGGAPKESGAARRASMDLTRALAEMRKP